jgi:hypothetical protein
MTQKEWWMEIFVDFWVLRVLQEMVRETKSLRPHCRKEEFYYASRLKGDKLAKT